jgi:hypothetical protein
MTIIESTPIFPTTRALNARGAWVRLSKVPSTRYAQCRRMVQRVDREYSRACQQGQLTRASILERDWFKWDAMREAAYLVMVGRVDSFDEAAIERALERLPS